MSLKSSSTSLVSWVAQGAGTLGAAAARRLADGVLPGRPPRLGDGRAHELLLRQGLGAVAQLADQRGAVVERQRPDVHAVHGGHRGDVARAQALEGADVEV